MSIQYLDPKRVQSLLYDDATPQNTSERCLVLGYGRGKIGDLMSNIIDNFPIEYATLNELNKDYLLVGYALGQSYYVDRKRQIKGYKN